MKTTKNIEFYSDDQLIKNILGELPKFDNCNGKTIIEFLGEETIGANLGTCLIYNDILYVLYKFDKALHKEKDVGLLMTKSHIKYAADHYKTWKYFYSKGMNLSSEFMNLLYNNFMFCNAINKAIV